MVVSFPENLKVFKQTTENSSGRSHSHREGLEKLMCIIYLQLVIVQKPRLIGNAWVACHFYKYTRQQKLQCCISISLAYNTTRVTGGGICIGIFKFN